MNHILDIECRKTSEDAFIKRCMDLCLERMEAEGIDTVLFDKVQVVCVTAGIVVMHFLNQEMHQQIAFHVHFEGNRYTGTPTYAMPINVNRMEETYTNTAKDAVTTLFAVCQ